MYLELTICQTVLFCTACLQMVGPQMCELELKFSSNILYAGQQYLHVVIGQLMFEQRRLRGRGWRRDVPGEEKKLISLAALDQASLKVDWKGIGPRRGK